MLHSTIIENDEDWIMVEPDEDDDLNSSFVEVYGENSSNSYQAQSTKFSTQNNISEKRPRSVSLADSSEAVAKPSPNSSPRPAAPEKYEDSPLSALVYDKDNDFAGRMVESNESEQDSTAAARIALAKRGENTHPTLCAFNAAG